MSFNDFIKNENKSIIWGLLQEVGVFNNIPNGMFENVKRLFESSILSMKPEFDVFFDKNDEGDEDYDQKASEMIMNSNKVVIKKMIEELKKIKNSNVNLPIQQQHQQGVHQQGTQQQQQSSQGLMVPPRFDVNPTRDTNKIIGNTGKKSKIEEIYRADDLQKSRMSELESRLKEKQQEMDTMLNNKKPESIDFSDSKLNDNKLAGDEMERLLAEALSSRNRELEVLSMNNTENSSKYAEEWISGSTDPVTNAVNASISIKRSNDIKRPLQKNNETNSSIQKKNVSFNENQNEQIVYEKEIKDQETNDETNRETNKVENGKLSFLSKLKVKNTLNDTSCDISDDTSHDTLYDFNNIMTPLDDYITEFSHDEDCHSHTGMNLYVNEKTRAATGAGDYYKFDKKIEKLQTDIENIKKTQERILELLQSK
jgi:hypothetical protein